MPGSLFPAPSDPTPAPASTAPSTVVPALRVEVLADGLDHPWDVAQAPAGTLLLDERSGGPPPSGGGAAAPPAVGPDGTVQEVAADFGDLFALGETGLMGLVLDPSFA